MEEFEVSDYGIFTDAVNTTNTLKSQIDDCQNRFNTAKNIVSDSNTFMGPVCDNVIEMFNKIDSLITDMTDNYNTINNYMMDVADAYAKGDKDAASVLLKLKGSVASDYSNPAGLSGNKLSFVNSLKDGAVEAYNKYGVLPSLTMAQAILESGWGNSAIGNNIFGIKAGSGWTGKTKTCKTGEQNSDGSRYTITATFRDYDSVAESVEDHAKLLTSSRYQSVIDSSNYKEACVNVKKCGYATDVNYANSLINIIETYGLDQWDPKA